MITHITSHRQLPPYAHAIIAARQRRSGDLHKFWGTSPDGHHPQIILCCGPSAWDAARDWAGRRLVTLLPPENAPDNYDWRFMAGTDPVLLWRCGSIEGNVVMQLVHAVMRDGTDRVLEIGTGTRYIAEVTHAA
jgi:hypothetical protein